MSIESTGSSTKNIVVVLCFALGSVTLAASGCSSPGAMGSGSRYGSVTATFSAASGVNANTNPFTSSAVQPPVYLPPGSSLGGLLPFSFSYSTSDPTQNQGFSVTLQGALASGKIYAVGTELAQENHPSTDGIAWVDFDASVGTWQSVGGGTVTVTSVSGTTVAFTATGVAMAPDNPGNGVPQGTFTLEMAGTLMDVAGL